MALQASRELCSGAAVYLEPSATTSDRVVFHIADTALLAHRRHTAFKNLLASCLAGVPSIHTRRSQW